MNNPVYNAIFRAQRAHGKMQFETLFTVRNAHGKETTNGSIFPARARQIRANEPKPNPNLNLNLDP